MSHQPSHGCQTRVRHTNLKKKKKHSPIKNEKRQRHGYKKIHKQKRGIVWVKQMLRRRRRRRGGGDDWIYRGYNENLAPTKVVCSIWNIFQLAFFLFFLCQPIYLFRPKSEVFTDIAGRTWYFSVFRVARNSRVSIPTVPYEINCKTRTLKTIFSMFKTLEYRNRGQNGQMTIKS